ncbi:MAG TPA: RHS repeat-associated core domain-containing protein [Chloroflexota bacterium]|nr:RHS repeat-associated core domain-containing protein [Chloroflexota bacterium]
MITYTAFGQRAHYAVTPAGAGQPSLSEHFWYQGDQLSQVAYTGTSITTPYTDTYVYSQDGTPLELLRQQGAGVTLYWYVLDGQGNVTALTDQSGAVVDSHSYDQWGKPLTISESVPQQRRYAGSWYDNELGWYWLSVRSYDPTLERFLQPDPSEQEGLFNYIYAEDNPSDLGDPSGLFPIPLKSGSLVTPTLARSSRTRWRWVRTNRKLNGAREPSPPAGGRARTRWRRCPWCVGATRRCAR